LRTEKLAASEFGGSGIFKTDKRSSPAKICAVCPLAPNRLNRVQTFEKHWRPGFSACQARARRPDCFARNREEANENESLSEGFWLPARG
jgi:hypothetical protein